MSGGGWIPLHKGLVRELPHDRPFTRLEAMFSLTLDYDEWNHVSVCGYSKLWRWSEGKVRRFLDEIGVSIDYPENTANCRNQRGGIAIVKAEESRRNCSGIKVIDSKWLSGSTKESRSNGEVKTKESQSTTIKPNPKPIKDLSKFDAFWNAYPRKVSKASALKSWQKLNPDSSLQGQILKALEWQSLQPDWQKDNGKFIPYASKWLNGRRWEDEQPTAKVIHLPSRSQDDELRDLEERGIL